MHTARCRLVAPMKRIRANWDRWLWPLVLVIACVPTLPEQPVGAVCARRCRVDCVPHVVAANVEPAERAVTVLAVIGAVRLGGFVEAGWPRAARNARWAALAAIGVVCAALAARTVARNREYSSAVSLARTIMARRPTSVAQQVLASS